MSVEPLVSVVVPTLDEAAQLPALLDHLAALPGRWEVIVADGGSRDGSEQVVGVRAARAPFAHLVHAPRGRAVQMNAGAALARGDVLLFLHADTRLPRGAYEALRWALAQPHVSGGNFALRFEGADRFSVLLGRWYALQRRSGVYYGDSAVWLRARAWGQLGGFRLLPIMEDYDLVRRLERLPTPARTVCLPGPVVTSSRRWRELGIGRTILTWVAIRWLYLAGVPAARLAALYRHVR